MTFHNYNKVALLPLRDDLRTGDYNPEKELFFDLMAQDVSVKINTPFQALNGVGMLLGKLYAKLYETFPNKENRDFIIMASPHWGKNNGEDWVMEDIIDIYGKLDINVFDRMTKMLNRKDSV